METHACANAGFDSGKEEMLPLRAATDFLTLGYQLTQTNDLLGEST
jgi:hypothetical protein